MSPRTIKSDLLWKVIVWVEWNYTLLSPPEQHVRPQRPYRANDGKTISPIITAVRREYHVAKLAHGKNADFDSCKKAVVAKMSADQGWDTATRNFYSSVVATYIGWDARVIPDKAAATLKLILAFATHTKVSTNQCAAAATLAKSG